MISPNKSKLSSWQPIGKFIKLVDLRNHNKKINLLLGINIKKKLIPSISNTTDVDLSSYKVIKKNQFVYSSMQTGRDETIRVSIYDKNEEAIISPAYSVFEIADTSVILPEYLMMWFLRPEMDRYGWFISDASIRTSLEWDRFCQIKIPLLSIEKQKSFVKLFRSIKKSQKVFDKSLEDLKIICESFINDKIKYEKKVKLGTLIEQTDERNIHSFNKNLFGISVKKEFIKSKAKSRNLDISNYKIVKPNHFGYVTVTSRNGNKISIALNRGKEGIISSTYIAFKITNEKVLLPEFLMLLFSRAEFDRFARYHSWGSARETFGWSEMCNVLIPLPSIEEQKAIILISQSILKRSKISNQLEEQLKTICPVFFKNARDEIKKGITK